MRALVVEHDPLSTPERVGAHLERRGISLDPLVVVEDGSDPEVTAVFPDTGHDLVVMMGSPWSVYDPRARGWVGPELDFITRLAKSGVPMLGICFGAQAMAAALGGSVAPSTRPEYGWGGIGTLVEPIAEEPWFQFHHDEISPPAGAVELARNASGTQAFRLGRGLGVQFHPEMTARLLASWYPAGAADALVGMGVDPDLLLEESEAR
ncbi:MAG TPA: type 1 glutamine amidotransferase, partial [Acidimicrobiia bacterium]